MVANALPVIKFLFSMSVYPPSCNRPKSLSTWMLLGFLIHVESGACDDKYIKTFLPVIKKSSLFAPLSIPSHLLPNTDSLSMSQFISPAAFMADDRVRQRFHPDIVSASQSARRGLHRVTPSENPHPRPPSRAIISNSVHGQPPSN